MTTPPRVYWRGSGDRRIVANALQQPVLEVHRDQTDEGPRWFVSLAPRARGLVAGPFVDFSEAAAAAYEAVSKGEV